MWVANYDAYLTIINVSSNVFSRLESLTGVYNGDPHMLGALLPAVDTSSMTTPSPPLGDNAEEDLSQL